jgi:hypothetical protein
MEADGGSRNGPHERSDDSGPGDVATFSSLSYHSYSSPHQSGAVSHHAWRIAQGWTTRRYHGRRDAPGATQRRIACELRCDLEMKFRKVEWGDPTLLCDEQKDLFRFSEIASPTHESAPTGS